MEASDGKSQGVLNAEEFNRLLKEIDAEPFRTMVLTAVCLGLRVSELAALQWGDFDWENLTVMIQRSIVANHVDRSKTRCSEKRMPLDSALVEVLLRWKQQSAFGQVTDWVFASPFKAGEFPYRPWGVQQLRITPAAKKADLGTGIGWHTFRHTYSTTVER